METRGYRNNNPGNIRISKDKWQGLKEQQTDKSFFQFVSMAYGFRALLRILQNYNRKNGCVTISDYIKRWAPSSENDTSAYIKSVCHSLQVSSDYVLNVNDRSVMIPLAFAIAKHENGSNPNIADIEDGWRLLCLK